MADNEIERLVVSLEADYADFLRQIDKAVQEAAQKLKVVDDTPKKAKPAWEQLESFLGGKFLSTVAKIGAAFAAAFAVNSVVNFFKSIVGAAVDANSQFEVFATQFETLLGSAEKAQGRLKELAQFSISTPFQLPDIVEADRLLQTFGGTILATGENLRRIGDSAAAVNANFKDVSFWTGRLFSSLQAGKPFGEAAMRLSELGILTPQVRQKMEEMHKSGATGMEIWEAYAEMIDTRFAGAMDKLSKTLQGVMSNLSDFQGMLLREGGEPLFEGIREDAISLFEFLDQNKTILVDLADSLGGLAETIRGKLIGPFLDQLEGIDTKRLASLAESLDNLSGAIAKLNGVETGNIDSMVSVIDGLTQTMADFINVVNTVKGLGEIFPGGQTLEEYLFGEKIIYMLDPIRLLGEALNTFTGGVEDTGNAAGGASTIIYQYSGAIEEAGEKTAEATDEFIKAKEALDAMSSGFQDLQEETNEKLAELLTEHGENITEIDQDFAEKQQEIAKDRDEALIQLEKDTAEKRQDIQEDTQKALAKLEEDTAKQREEINERAQDDLAKLADDTNSSIDKLQEEHRTKEKRETEDHQRDMQRIQDQYLFDLEDAVKNRDARAIVDLRRRFQMEKREKESTFRTDQRREDEDLSGRIKDIRTTERQRRQEILKSQRDQLSDLEESEAEKREEILASQAEQLADLAQNEAEKRQSIEDSYQEQMAKAEEHHAEQIARENERYEERRQKLEEALAKRLEDEMKALADQKDITEEGAKAILEALNKVFGVDGDIDALMEEFKARRREKMTIQIEFDKSIEDTEDTPSRHSQHPGFDQGFQFGGLIPGPTGMPRRIIAHGGEEIVPVNEVARLNQMRQSMNGGGGEMRVKLDITGSAPPGIRGGEVEQISGVLVQALNEAGIRARR